MGSTPSFGSRPDLGHQRPDFGNRPSPIERPGPGGRPGPATRPSPGEIGDFLGIDTRPGVRPGQGGIGTLQGNRPITDRSIGNRPLGIDNRPVDINTAINRRPSSQNLDRQQVSALHDKWQGAVANRPERPGQGMANWKENHPDRVQHWQDRAATIHDHWRDYDRRGWFNETWWRSHPHPFAPWHYHYAWKRYPWVYWWTRPTWVNVSLWFAPWGWTQPYFYDYGAGGNVVYNDNTVYVNGEEVGSAEDFAKSAAELATVPPPASEEEVEKTEWMPLGTFAVSTDEQDTNPSRVLQLAVSKEGIISGTLYNSTTDQALSVQGQVDKKTQRVAFRIGDNDDMVVETGLYDLLQDQAPILVHFGTDRVEQYLLVRLQQPEEGQPGAEQ